MTKLNESVSVNQIEDYIVNQLTSNYIHVDDFDYSIEVGECLYLYNKTYTNLDDKEYEELYFYVVNELDDKRIMERVRDELF